MTIALKYGRSTVTQQDLDSATARYETQLAELEAAARASNDFSPAILGAIGSSTREVLRVCAAFAKTGDADDVAAGRRIFHQRTASWLEQSQLIHRARHWPRGYQGDFELLEAAYSGTSWSRSGLALYLDLFVLGLDLGQAVRGRLHALEGILSAELSRRTPGARVANIACGPCRELFHISSLVAEREARVVCLDHDHDALDHAARLLATTGLRKDQLQFVRANALRLVDEKVVLKLFGHSDLIYSSGLFDYLQQRTVVRLLKAAYLALRPGGKIIVSFKDAARYDVTPFHWLMNWTGFLAREVDEIRELPLLADIPSDAAQLTRDRTGIVIFLTLTRT